MLDIRLLRESPDMVRADLAKRGRDAAAVDEVLRHDTAWRDGQHRLDALRSERNKAAKAIAEAKKAARGSGGGREAAGGGEGRRSVAVADEAIAAMTKVSAAIRSLEDDVAAAAAARDASLRRIPNLMHESVPVGEGEEGNVELRRWPAGDPPSLPFAGVSHVDLLDLLDGADLERAARAAGARFFYLKGDLVRLGRALESFALDFLRDKGFTAVQPPFLLRREAVEGAVDLADFESVIYKVEAGAGATREDAPELFLIATSEHALAALHMGEIIATSDLPRLYAGISTCFRKEAGAHGKDTKGIFRVHQFDKVEQFALCTAAQSWDWHERLIANAEELYRGLGIPHRVVDICTGDLGTVAARKYDLEAWMPVQGKYREVVSCSNCTDYQARRLGIRHRPNPGDPTQPVHTLNATAIAVQRTLVAILENFQQPDGTVTVPEVLRPYLGGQDALRPASPRDVP